MQEIMSKRKWFVLLCIEISYLLLGACFFYRIESIEETNRRTLERTERREIEVLVKLHYLPTSNDTQEEIFTKLSRYCEKPIGHNMAATEPPLRWDFYHSSFFVFTVISTLGYGNLTPTTMLGRIVMIFYALIGIPLNGILMVTLADFFGKKFTHLYERWKSGKIHDIETNLGLVGQIALYLIPGFTFFIFLPSVVIMIMEGWDYDVAVYYSFVTLTTIGFGDYIAGVKDNNFGVVLFTTYKIFLLVWITIGLGYIVMVLGFISRGLRSKKVLEIEQLLAENIRRTPLKFRALKSLVYEILLMKLKPVYKKGSIAPIQLTRRAISLPDLTLIYDDPGSACRRKRAKSETIPSDLPVLHRVASDSNLQNIDIELTFTSKKEQKQHELLRKLSHFVNSYEGKLKAQSTIGVNCFSSDEILESEKSPSQWMNGKNSSLQQMSTPSIKIGATTTSYEEESNNMTWYGQTAARKAQEMREQLKHGRARSRTLPVQDKPLLKLAPQGNFFNRLRSKFVPMDTYKEQDMDIEKQAKAPRLSVPQIKFQRKRTQSECPSSSKFSNNVFTSEEEREMKQLAHLLVKLAQHDEEPESESISHSVIAPRSRRFPIIPTHSRRTSLASPSPTRNENIRRFSLRPSEDTGSLLGTSSDRPRRFSLRPVTTTWNTSSPVQRRRLRNTKEGCKDNIIIENELMK